VTALQAARRHAPQHFEAPLARFRLVPARYLPRDQAAAGLIDRLYVHSPDRLARKYAYKILLIEEFQRCGIEVVLLNHEIGDKPEEQLLLQISQNYPHAWEKSRQKVRQAGEGGCSQIRVVATNSLLVARAGSETEGR
jgi:hypothetical protein